MEKINKTLYVCRANIGRSQVAMEFHNEIAPGTADSAGIKIDEVSAKHLEDWKGSQIVIKAMRDRGIDLSRNTRHEISREEVTKYGRVVVLAEIEVIPVWIAEAMPELWVIPDLKDKSIDQANEIIDLIEERVVALVDRDYTSSYTLLPRASRG